MAFVWKTREGKEIELKNITDIHILNIYDMLSRLPTCYLVGDSWDGEVDCDFVEDYELKRTKGIIGKEIRKRKLR